ncbi:DUF4365 domain-containing protein [Coleofasciculus sp. E2-BRE-01]|uniref:DUF4365 domain-containing protein n=1 Tax=Coleofasciculus sp. E2-BRE-01 TaxID=3069524 RepID=UPI0032F20C73
MKAKKSNRIERQGIAIAMSAFEKIDYAFREQQENDYGVDAHAELIENEEATGRLLGIQIKTGLSYLSEPTPSGYVYRCDIEHIEYWINHSLPIMLTLCNPETSTIFWQHISQETVIRTGKQFKIIVPFNQKVEEASREKLENLLTPIVPTNCYTVFRTHDFSDNTAKRYSLDIVLNGLKTKAEIASAIRQATTESVKRRYYRDDRVEGRWGDADADVVWIYAYLSADERAKHIWVCRSIWIREYLPDNSRPDGFKGENIGGLITVDWRSDYQEFAKLIGENTFSKEDYIKQVNPLICELEELLIRFDNELENLIKSKIQEADFIEITQKTRERIDSLDRDSTDMNYAPYECTEVNSQFRQLVALIANMVLYYSEQEIKKWSSETRIRQAKKYSSDARIKLTHLRYELSKVR